MTYAIKPIARMIAAGAIMSAFILGAPSLASAAPDNQRLAQATSTQAAPPASGTTTPPSHVRSHPRMSPTDRVEGRIKEMHASLHITAAQEPQWGAVAQSMRDSAKSIEALAGDRTQKISTMNAIDDLRSYESLAAAHADGLKKVVAAFAPLYDGMSDSQKKAADDLFRHRGRHQTAAKKS
jgi:protein CpxP